MNAHLYLVKFSVPNKKHDFLHYYRHTHESLYAFHTHKSTLLQLKILDTPENKHELHYMQPPY